MAGDGGDDWGNLLRDMVDSDCDGSEPDIGTEIVDEAPPEIAAEVLADARDAADAEHAALAGGGGGGGADQEEAPKAKRGRKRKQSAGGDQEEAPKAKRGRKRKQSDDGDQEEAPKAPPKYLKMLDGTEVAVDPIDDVPYKPNIRGAYAKYGLKRPTVGHEVEVVRLSRRGAIQLANYRNLMAEKYRLLYPWSPHAINRLKLIDTETEKRRKWIYAILARRNELCPDYRVNVHPLTNEAVLSATTSEGVTDEDVERAAADYAHRAIAHEFPPMQIREDPLCVAWYKPYATKVVQPSTKENPKSTEGSAAE